MTACEESYDYRMMPLKALPWSGWYLTKRKVLAHLYPADGGPGKDNRINVVFELMNLCSGGLIRMGREQVPGDENLEGLFSKIDGTDRIQWKVCNEGSDYGKMIESVYSGGSAEEIDRMSDVIARGFF